MKKYKLKRVEQPHVASRYVDELNAEQLAVVEYAHQPLLVLAGAGSGKTRALTYRVAHMIDRGVRPNDIVLLTFTNRAARSMIERVESIIGMQAHHVQAGTFHSLAHRYLRQYAEEIGYRRQFTVLDRDDAKDMLNAAMVDYGIEKKQGRFPRADRLLKLMSYAINTQTPIAEVLSRKAPHLYALSQEIGALCAFYLERKAERSMMDFDDLLVNFYRLLTEAPSGKQLKNQIQAVLVDEYQDTNRLQALIIDALAEKTQNMTVVGDDAQSIYAFRGADIDNMFTFDERYPTATQLKLETNYRSSPEILALANETLQFARKGFPKKLKAVRDTRDLPALVPTHDAAEQALFIVQNILELRDEGVEYDDMAILYRSHANSMDLQVELARAGIPFMVRSGIRFFEQAHIKDIVAYIRLLENPLDEVAFRRAARLWRGLGEKSVSSLWRGHLDRQLGEQLSFNALTEAVAPWPKKRREAAQAFIQSLVRADDPTYRSQPSRLILDLLEPALLNYKSILKDKFNNAKERLADIEQLSEYAIRYESCAEFLSDLALAGTAGLDATDEQAEPEPMLTLSSIHQSKGLEWNTVFIPWLIEGQFPSEMSLREDEHAEEERRLFYVAVTRAKDRLTMTYPMTRVLKDGLRIMTHPSRFIWELEKGDDAEAPLFERWMLETADDNMLEPGDSKPLLEA